LVRSNPIPFIFSQDIKIGNTPYKKMLTGPDHGGTLRAS